MTRFYADENIEEWLVELLREKGFKIKYSIELGFTPRDDKFHFQYAKKNNLVLLSHDLDYWDDKVFPFLQLKNIGILMVGTQFNKTDLNFGFVLNSILDIIGKAGNKNLCGHKIQVVGSLIKVKANINGKIQTDQHDFKYDPKRDFPFG